MPIDEVNLDMITNLIVLPLMSEDGNFNKSSSIGFTFFNFLRVIDLNADALVRAKIYNIELKSIEQVHPVYTGAVKLMRDNVA